jgi:hypothetical protein
MVWLANWCFVRGQNLLFPHAFYYSIRGPRFDERPPDVGPNSDWWTNYKSYADACSWLSWLNTDSRQVCELAILGEATYLPDKSAKICFQHQLDFNYLEIRHLWESARIDKEGVHIAGMNYKAIILDSLSYLPAEAKPFLRRLAKNDRLIVLGNHDYGKVLKGANVVGSPDKMINAVIKNINPDIRLNPASENIRYRHVVKENADYYILFNEEESPLKISFKSSSSGKFTCINPYTSEVYSIVGDEPVSFGPYELKVIKISKE